MRLSPKNKYENMSNAPFVAYLEDEWYGGGERNAHLYHVEIYSPEFKTKKEAKIWLRKLRKQLTPVK